MRYCIFLLFIFLNISFSGPLQKVTLQLQWKHQFEFAGFYAAKEQGFYEQAGLDVEFKEFESGMDITAEVLSTRADYGTSYSSIIRDYLRQKPIVLVANFFKQSPLVLVTRPEIKSPRDLKGKKVMGLLDSTHNPTLLSMLKKFEVSTDDFTNVSRRFAIDSFINKEVDAISAFTTNEIFTLNQKGIAYNVLDPVAFGIKFYDVNLFTSKEEAKNHPQRVQALRQATIKGWEYALSHKEEIAELILQQYNTQNKTKEALLFEAKQIEYLMLTNVYPVGSVDLKMIQAIADSYKQEMTAKVLNTARLDDFVFASQDNKLTLTKTEQNYLKQKKIISMCVDPNWMPLEAIENNKHVGIAAEVMELISKKFQTPVELVPAQSWSQSLQKAKNKECDILSLAEKTPNRSKYLDFTLPYVQTPLVVATKEGLPFFSNLETIKDKSLGVVADFSIVELLKQKYKGINLVEVESVAQGLEDVRKEKLFGFLDNALVLNNEIHKQGFYDVVISGQFEQMFALGIATRNDEPLLHQIMQKALLSIKKEDIESIVSKWSNVNYQVTYDYTLISQILFLTVAGIGIFAYWNMRLRDEMRQKDAVKVKLKASEERFRTLFDLAPVMIDSFDEEGRVQLWNKECQKVFGWRKEELQQSSDPLSLFYPDLKDKAAVLDNLHESFAFKQWNPVTKEGKKLVTMWANVHMPNGEIIHVGYDITAQREDELQLKQKTKELEDAKQKLQELNNTLEQKVKKEIEKNLKQQLLLLQQNRLAQMGEMIENIAHQWRQPLAQINSCVLILDACCEKEKALKDGGIKEKLNEIESLTAYMSKTIDDFKNFFNPDKTKENFFLHETVENAYAIVKGALRVNYIEIEIKVEKNLQVSSYIQELEHVFIIIFNNAKDAFVANKTQNPKITIISSREDDYIKLCFCDNAGGILPQNLEKIFQPYFTTKHKTQGTGLGLYMAKMIIEEGLQGGLTAYNQKEGACFQLHLPKE